VSDEAVKWLESQDVQPHWNSWVPAGFFTLKGDQPMLSDGVIPRASHNTASKPWTEQDERRWLMTGRVNP